MIKYTILLFNLMGLFLYQLFFQANVSATQSVPQNANAGSSFVVEVTINKADISGFAKYQEDLPPGFTATAIEKQGATVLSSDNAIKFIWASLPADATVKISIRITVDASVSGSQSLSGKFLYVVNNERQQTDVASSTIMINSASAAVAATAPVTTPAATSNTTQPVTTPATTDNTTQPVSTPTVAATAPVTTPTVAVTESVVTQPVPTPTVAVTAPATPAANINITRSYSETSVAQAADLSVSLTIHKGNLSGFAKLEETIPSGLVIAEGEKKGASFTFVDGKAKFVWLSLPNDSVFTVTYKITVTSTVSGDQSIAGEFSYLVDNNAIKYPVTATSFSVKNPEPITAVNLVTQPAASTEPVANTTQPVATNPTPTVNATPPADTTHTTTLPVNTTQPVANTTQPVTQQPANTDMTNAITPHVSSSTGGVNYRVQIMALHNAVKTSYLAKKYGISETINEEMLEGYTKYTIGKFDEYKSVHDRRDEIKGKGVEGPFVVAYNEGKRITVQEALMITKQQWYK